MGNIFVVCVWIIVVEGIVDVVIVCFVSVGILVCCVLIWFCVGVFIIVGIGDVFYLVFVVRIEVLSIFIFVIIIYCFSCYIFDYVFFILIFGCEYVGVLVEFINVVGFGRMKCYYIFCFWVGVGVCWCIEGIGYVYVGIV